MRLRRRILFCVLALLAWGGVNLLAWTYLERRDERIRAKAAGVPYEVVSRFEERTATVVDDQRNVRGALRYRFFQPPELASDRLYPTVLYLHGAGERGNDNVRQVRGVPRILTKPDVQAKFPCFVVAPQCPQGMRWSNRSALDGNTCDGLMVALSAVNDVLAEYPADPDRVYLIGFSMGGFGVWELAAREPERFAAVVPIAGGGNPEWASRLVDVPLRAVHGTADEVVPAEQSREMIAAIRAAGGSPRFDEILGAPHGSWRNLLAEPSEFLGWLHRQTR